MKILYFLDFPFFVGGSNKVLLTQAFIMQQRGFQVKIIIPNDENGCHSLEYDRICSTYHLDAETECYHVYTCMEAVDIWAAFREYESILRLIIQYKPDLIHSTQLNIAAELAARKLEIPHLMNIYQVDCQSFRLKWLNIYPQYHSADSIMMSERWHNGLGISSRCIRVAYKLKKNIKTNYDWNGMAINIISIGVVYEPKNQLEVIKFIQMCKRNGRNVKLKILGDCSSEYALKCKKYVEENELTDYVLFMGFVSNVEECLQKSDLFILASTVESYPGVIVESMANKIPIISTAVAGVPELLKDGENGFLVEGYEAKDIYQTFLRYLEYRDSGEIYQVIENAYGTYLKYHTYEAVGEQLADYYQWITEDFHNKHYKCLTKEKIECIFNDFISDRKIDRNNIHDMRYVWFMYHFFPLLENRKIVIWGAGFWGSIVLRWISLLEKEINFWGFVDIEKHGKYLGYLILSDRETAILECDIIIVAVTAPKAVLEIRNYLEKYNKQRNQDYFLIYNEPIKI